MRQLNYSIIYFGNCQPVFEIFGFLKPHIVKSSATSSLITRDPEVKLSGLAQTEISRIDIEEVVWGAH